VVTAGQGLVALAGEAQRLGRPSAAPVGEGSRMFLKRRVPASLGAAPSWRRCPMGRSG
jgi:hypothetical protein